mmetsp:Transcript_23567/g.31252  ORF Transcript_23567/g.31252 Transcript_23567/m.31252 type:complete len:123 (+) Transcript_23567:108-476(+)
MMFHQFIFSILYHPNSSILYSSCYPVRTAFTNHSAHSDSSKPSVTVSVTSSPAALVVFKTFLSSLSSLKITSLEVQRDTALIISTHSFICKNSFVIITKYVSSLATGPSMERTPFPRFASDQ